MALYGRSDIAEVNVGATGHRHTAPVGDPGPFRLDCPECEAVLRVQEAAFWSVSPEDAPLTEAEKRIEQATKEESALALSAEFQQFLAWKRGQAATR